MNLSKKNIFDCFLLALINFFLSNLNKEHNKTLNLKVNMLSLVFTMFLFISV